MGIEDKDESLDEYVKDILFRTYGDSVTILEVGRIISELLDNISKWYEFWGISIIKTC